MSKGLFIRFPKGCDLRNLLLIAFFKNVLHSEHLFRTKEELHSQHCAGLTGLSRSAPLFYFVFLFLREELMRKMRDSNAWQKFSVSIVITS